MRISQARAIEAAEKITSPLRVEIETMEANLAQTIKSMLVKRIPKEVLSSFKKYPEFFRSSSSEYIRNGISKSFSFKEQIPDPTGEKYALTTEDLHKIAALYNLIEDKRKSAEDAERKIKNTILALGTEKRIATEFPEVVPYLDYTPTNTGLALNVAPVRMLACSLIPGCEKKAKK